MEMDILEKCAYIKGLAEGLSLDATKPEGKVLNAIIDLLGDIVESIADMDEEAYSRLCSNAARAAAEYSFENLTKKLLSVIESISK